MCRKNKQYSACRESRTCELPNTLPPVAAPKPLKGLACVTTKGSHAALGHMAGMMSSDSPQTSWWLQMPATMLQKPASSTQTQAVPVCDHRNGRCALAQGHTRAIAATLNSCNSHLSAEHACARDPAKRRACLLCKHACVMHFSPCLFCIYFTHLAYLTKGSCRCTEWRCGCPCPERRLTRLALPKGCIERV